MLKATPGVLGVDAARTISGKQVIFAWFEKQTGDAHVVLQRAAPEADAAVLAGARRQAVR